MSYVHPAWLEHQRQRFTKPEPIQRKTYAERLVEQRQAAEEEERAAIEQDAFEREVLKLRRELAGLKLEYELRRFQAKYSPDQPRVPAGNPDGGQWTSGGHSTADVSDIEQSQTRAPTAPDQPPRSDLSELQALTSDSAVRGRIEDAWNASNPSGARPQEHGFWISRNATTGELFTRPFANPGSAARITPGPVPQDAISFFHTHPNRTGDGYVPGPSRADEAFAAAVGLPGVLLSHNGMYYFGPSLRPSGRR